MADPRLLPPGIADTRNQALLDLTDRVANIDRSVLFTYRLDSTPAAALYALAWQFAMTGLAGWDLAGSEDERRELLRRAIEFHRHRGTPWVITEALKVVGWPDAELDEHFGAARYDGTFKYDGTIKYSFGASWAKFAVIVGELADDVGLTDALRVLLRGIIETWKNARSQLIELAFNLPPMSDQFAAFADSPMAIDLTTSHRYNGVYKYDGTIDYSGSDTVTLATV